MGDGSQLAGEPWVNHGGWVSDGGFLVMGDGAVMGGGSGVVDGQQQEMMGQ